MSEGKPCDFVFIFKTGEFRVTRCVVTQKQSRENHSKTVKDFEMKLCIMGEGRMIGDYEVCNGLDA
jgi:mannose-6-phosphate isomerase class I